MPVFMCHHTTHPLATLPPQDSAPSRLRDNYTKQGDNRPLSLMSDSEQARAEKASMQQQHLPLSEIVGDAAAAAPADQSAKDKPAAPGLKAPAKVCFS